MWRLTVYITGRQLENMSEIESFHSPDSIVKHFKILSDSQCCILLSLPAPNLNVYLAWKPQLSDQRYQELFVVLEMQSFLRVSWLGWC